MIYRQKPIAKTPTQLIQGSNNYGTYVVLWICNVGNNEDYFSVYLLNKNEVNTTNTNIYSKVSIPANDTFTTSPIILGSGDKLLVESENGNLIFTATPTSFGVG